MAILGFSGLGSGWRVSGRLMVAVLVPAGFAGWLLYSGTQQRDALEERNMRWLGHMASQVQKRVANFDNAVERWTEVDTVTPAHQTGVTPANQFGVVENLDTEKCPEQGANLGVTKKAGKPLLHFRQERKGGAGCAVSDLALLVEQSLRKDVFASIILAERNGNVLYQSDSGPMRFTSVDFLFAPAAEPALKPLLGEAAAAKPVVASGSGLNAPTSSAHMIRSIGDHQFAVYVQPIQLTLRDPKAGPAPGDWLLVGLSDVNTPWKNSGPQGLLLILPLVMLLVALSWPLPKPWFMSPAEPLRQRYLAWAGACSVGILLVMTVLGLYFFIRHFSDVRTDGRLNLFAEEIGSNLKHELTLALEQLRLLDERAAQEKVIRPDSSGSSESSLFASLKPEQTLYRFEYVDWIDGDGQKRFRWTTGKDTARPVNVSDRAYFQNVMADRMVHGLPLATGGYTSTFAIEQVLSRTTGRMTTMLAVNSELKYQGLPVASMAALLTSLENPVLPAEFGFAVIEPSGKVLFHSEPSRALAENLFEECADVPELAQVVERRATATVSTNYSGAAYRMLVTPFPDLEDLPWTLVVFRKLEPVRVIRAQAMVGAGALFVAYLLASLAVAGGLLYLLGLRWRRFEPRLLVETAWWAPRPDSYPLLAAFGAALMLVYWRGLDRQLGSSIFYSSVATAVAFLIFSALGLRMPVRQLFNRFSLAWLAGASLYLAAFALVLDDPWMAGLAPAGLLAVRAGQHLRQRGSSAQPATAASWVIWAAGLALCLVVLPTFGLGKLSYEYESGLYARELQWELQEEYSQRVDEITRSINKLPGVTECGRIGQHLLSGLGLRPTNEFSCAPTFFYGSAGYNTELVGTPGGELSLERRTCRISAWAVPAPKGAVLSRVCMEGQGLVPQDKFPAALFSEEAPAWWKVLNQLPILILAGVELPFDARQEGFDMRRDQFQPAGDPAPWSWRVEGGGNAHHLWLARESTAGPQPLARSVLPGFVPWNPFADTLGPEAGELATQWMSVQFWLGMIAVIGLTLYWARAFRRRVRLDDLELPDPLPAFQPELNPHGERLLVHLPPGHLELELPGDWSGFHRFDLLLMDLATPPPVPAGHILIEHLETRLQTAAERKACLDLLEAALRIPQRSVVITTAIEPLHYLQTGGAGMMGDPADDTELRRWSRITHSLPARRLGVPDGAPMPDDAGVWMSCSALEKAMLTYLDREKLVTPTAADSARALMGRGLLRRRPDGRIEFASPRFQRFVHALKEAPDEALLAAHSVGKTISPWAIGLVLVGVVLFFSQEELTSRLLGFLTSVGAGLETLRKHLSASSGTPGGSSGTAKG
ncbi:MAG: hypothetical protein NTZ56_06350 [Acidobacteria bacterium]|nr:hypothetical protein [Acidobacteriota bacterium]